MCGHPVLLDHTINVLHGLQFVADGMRTSVALVHSCLLGDRSDGHKLKAHTDCKDDDERE